MVLAPCVLYFQNGFGIGAMFFGIGAMDFDIGETGLVLLHWFWNWCTGFGIVEMVFELAQCFFIVEMVLVLRKWF